MKLELKHLVPYLPYELRIFHSDFMFRNNWNENEIGTMVGITDVVELDVLGETTFDIVMRRDKDLYKLHDSRGHFKPILRPLSDLTKEHMEKINSLLPNVPNWQDFHKEWINEKRLDLSETIIEYAVMEILLEYHFDVFGLIDQGLAININTI